MRLGTRSRLEYEAMLRSPFAREESSARATFRCHAKSLRRNEGVCLVGGLRCTTAVIRVADGTSGDTRDVRPRQRKRRESRRDPRREKPEQT